MTNNIKCYCKGEAVANVLLGGAGLICILAFFYFFYHYGWIRDRQFTGSAGFLVYYILPAVLAGQFFNALRFRPVYKVRLAGCYFVLTFLLYGVELLLAYSRPAFPADEPIQLHDVTSPEKKNAVSTLAREFGVEFDTRDSVEVITQLRAQGLDAVPGVLPRSLLQTDDDGRLKSSIAINGAEVLPLSGISGKLTLSCNESGRYFFYRSDEYGFHNPKGVWSHRDLQVAALGDSFTSGACLGAETNFLDLLRKHYPATLNLGMGGHGPLLRLATLKEYLPRLRPRLVLWVYDEAFDLAHLNKEKSSPLLMSYFRKNFYQRLVARRDEVDEILTNRIEAELAELFRRSRGAELRYYRAALVKHLLLSQIRDRTGLNFGKHPKLDSEPRVESSDLHLLREILLETKFLVEGWNGRLSFVYLPSWKRYAGGPKAETARESVLALVDELGIRIIDIHPVFQAQPDPLSLFPFRRFLHYTDDGHRLVALELLKTISLN